MMLLLYRPCASINISISTKRKTTPVTKNSEKPPTLCRKACNRRPIAMIPHINMKKALGKREKSSSPTHVPCRRLFPLSLNVQYQYTPSSQKSILIFLRITLHNLPISP